MFRFKIIKNVCLASENIKNTDYSILGVAQFNSGIYKLRYFKHKDGEDLLEPLNRYFRTCFCDVKQVEIELRNDINMIIKEGC